MLPNLLLLQIAGFFLILETVLPSDNPIRIFPYVEDFQSVSPPELPHGWTTSGNRNAAGDFETEIFQNATRLLARNATIEQFVRTPAFDFTGFRPDRIGFHERRSGTFGAEVILSAILGGSEMVEIGRTNLAAPNVFQNRIFELPARLINEPHVVFEWRILPVSEGASGLLRYDQIELLAHPVLEHDLRLTRFRLDPPYPTTSDELQTEVVVLNRGISDAAGFFLHFMDSGDRLLHTEPVQTPIPPDDSIRVVSSFPSTEEGDKWVTVYLDYPPNQQTGSSTITRKLTVARPVSRIPWSENFSDDAEHIPSGWRTSYTGDSPDAEMITTIVHSGAAALLLRNAARGQYIVLPPFDPDAGIHEKLTFFERRTGTFDATVEVSLSFDSGRSFGEPIARFSHSGESGYVLRSIPLPEPDADHRPFYIRISSAGDGTGTTGTIRLDGFEVSGKLHHDVLIESVDLYPDTPIVGEPVSFSVRIVNNGLSDAAGISVRMYRRISDSDDTLLIGAINSGSPLGYDDRLLVEFAYIPERPVEKEFIFVVDYPFDRNTDNNVYTLFLHPAPVHSSVVINEIMYAPASPEPEWIELYNRSSAPVNLRGWRFGDRDTTRHYTITGSDFTLRPGEYALVTKDASIFQAYDTIPSPVIQVPAKPTFLWNSQGDVAYIYDHNGKAHDRVEFTPAWGGTGGSSLERIDHNNLSGDRSNWGSSAARGTPGFENSIGRKEYDLAIRSLTVHPAVPEPLQPVVFLISIVNRGRARASGFGLALYSDSNPDQIDDLTYGSVLEPLDSIVMSLEWREPSPGYTSMSLYLDYPPDQRQTDNYLEFELLAGFPPRTLIVNEILYHPRENQPEFVEIYNPGTIPVDIRNWSIRDRETPGGRINRYVLSEQSHNLHPGDFMILSSDSTLFGRYDIPQGVYIRIENRTGLGFTTTGDEVLLLDPSGAVVDSVPYLPAWHHPDIVDVRGKSLERISPLLSSTDRYNWSTSADPAGATPGRANSLYTETPPLSASLTAHPNPFSPTGDGFRDHTIVSFRLPTSTGMVRLRIFDSVGREIRTLLNHSPSGPEGYIVWDGRDERGRRVRLGIYILLLEAYDARGGNLVRLKQTVVVADRL